MRTALDEADADLIDAAARLDVAPFGGPEDLLHWLNEATQQVCVQIQL